MKKMINSAIEMVLKFPGPGPKISKVNILSYQIIIKRQLDATLTGKKY